MSAVTRARAVIPVVCALAVLAGTNSHSAASAGGFADSGTTGRLLVTLETPTAPAPPSASGELTAPAAKVLALRDDRLDATEGAIDRVAARNDLELTRAIPEVGVIVVDPGDRPLDELSAQLRADPLVAAVGLERRVQLRFTPNDPAFTLRDANAPGNDFHLWPLLRYQAQQAWNLSKGGSARVAVIDTGAYVAHPDLSGNLAGTLDCTGAVDDPDGCTPGGNVSDPVGHGTHTSGLACADTNDGYGIASLGFRCNLDVIKTDLSFGSVTASIVAAANRGADAISMSFGGSFDGPMVNALEYAYNGGAVLVAAGANKPTPSQEENYPAQWVQRQGSGPNLNAGRGLVVTMAKHDGTRNIQGQKNSGVSVAAYGSATDELSGGQQGILSTWPPPIVLDDVGGVRTNVGGSNNYAYLVGTSMATPQVAGLVALIRHVRPGMSNDKVARLIKLTADGRGDYGRGLGWGIINAHAALGAALARDVIRPRSRVRWVRVRGARVANRRPRLILRLGRFDPRRPGVPRSGVRIVNVFVSVNGGRYKRFRKTRRKRIRFRGRHGRSYRFYTRAVDRAGNREARPARPDVFRRVP